MTAPKQTPPPAADNSTALKRLELKPNERQLLDEITSELSQLIERRTGMIIAVAKLNGLKVQAVDYVDGALCYVPLMINEQQQPGPVPVKKEK